MQESLCNLKDLDITSLCRLNNEHAVETSFLTEIELSRLIGMSFYARGFVGDMGNAVAALLIALDSTAPYVNPNFQFFRERHSRFVYIDRLITAGHARRRRLARRLYEDLFEQTKQAGHSVIGCEVNLDPPNPGSDAFHASLGFAEVGRATLANGKTVRYLEMALA